MENGQSTAAKLGLPPLTPEQQEALQKVSKLDVNLLLSALVSLGLFWFVGVGLFVFCLVLFVFCFLGFFK